MRFAAAAGLVALLVACRHARAEEAGAAPEDEPSIEEMLAEIESQKKPAASPGAGPVVSRPEPPRPPAVRPPTPRRASKPVKLSQSVEKEIKRLQRRAHQCRKVLARRKDNWGLIQLYNRLEQYKLAAKVLSPMLRGRPPARGGERGSDAVRAWEWGGYHLEYAMIMKHLGQEATVRAMLAEHKKRLGKARANPVTYRRPQSYHLKPIMAKLEFFENYDEAKSQIDELEGELAAAPDDAEMLMEIASLCKPANFRKPVEYQAELPLKWFATIYGLVAKHPDHELVQSGRAHWELGHAYNYHSMHEDSVKTFTMMLERFPDFPEVRRGNCLWTLAASQEHLGRLSEAVGDRTGAGSAYRAAIERYKEFKKRFPEDYRSNAHKSSTGTWTPATADRAVHKVQEMLARLGA
jgi:tetratricopeptide (TPR) repeat protein